MRAQERDGRRNMKTATTTIDTLRGARSLVITRTEAAAALGVDPRTVTAAIENGTIPAVKLGKRVVIPREKFLKIFDPED